MAVNADVPIDNFPPESITNLTNTTYASNYINWTWNIPVERVHNTDFSNGGFESGNFSGWGVWGDPNNCSEDTICEPVWCDVLTNASCIVRSMFVNTSDDSFTNNYSALLGHYNEYPNTSFYSKLDLRQNINLTPENTALSLYTKVFSENIGVNQKVYDYFIIVDDGNEHVIWTLSDTNSSVIPLNNWTLLTFNLSEYSGKNITLIFRFMQDFCCGNEKQWDLVWSGTSLWYLDDIEITSVNSTSNSSDLARVMIDLNGVHVGDVPAAWQYYQATNLTSSTTYEIGTRTVDFSGNINSTWVNHTATTAPGRVHNINKSTDYFTIQAAIDDATQGDMIYVDSGTYYENVNVNKQLILKGIDTGLGKPVVDASESGSVITLSAGNSTLDGFEAIRSGWQYAGIHVNSNNNLIQNNNASNNHKGIFLSDSSNSNAVISNNVLNNQIYGIFLGGSGNNILRENYVSDNHMYGFYIGSSPNNILVGNYVSNNHWNGIYLESSNSNTLSGNNVSNTDGEAISLWSFSNSNKLINNNVSNNNANSISIWGSNNNILICNNVSNNNGTGISLWGSSENILTYNNALSNHADGIYLRGAINNTINGNNLSYNRDVGISLGTDSSNNTLSENYVFNNINYGISLWDFSNNNIIYNNFFNNQNNVEIINSTNIWNITQTNTTNIISGPYIGGNVWSKPDGLDFSRTCPDNNKDKICDSPYILNSDNVDYLPLALPLHEGGVSVSVSRSSMTVVLNIKVINTQNVDDIFKIFIDVSELPLSYQADIGWFDWTEQIVSLKAGQEVIIPINITIPDTVTGTKMFRVKANSTTSGIYAYDTGYLKLI
jgi:parallel beta-helix repeat protein